jgi:small subunit ribosomal protein S1
VSNLQFLLITVKKVYFMETEKNLESETEFDFGTENFQELLKDYIGNSQSLEEGSVVKGVIVEINDKMVAVDIGGKSIGYVDASEFSEKDKIEVGEVIDVFIERLENKRGELIISRENAKKFNNWNFLKRCLEDKTIIEGKILGKVKGGFAVDIDGVIAFLPRSQVDTLALIDIDEFVGKTEKFMVLKIDDGRGNVVVSRRAILEEERSQEREEILSTIKVGDVLEGIVKNLTDYGAFIDFGSFDGLLHLTDISWCRVRHPSEVLKLGQKVKVQVIKFDEDSKRVSLGMKQLQDNPWETISKKYPVGTVVKGRVKNIAQYGAFVEIENGIEGLVHVSEMSWLKNNNAPSKMLSVGQEAEVMVLDIDAEHHRISLGIKQCEKNPWQDFSEKYKVGDVIEGTIKNVTDFGLFVGFESGVDGLVHISDVAWEEDKQAEEIKKFKKDEKIKVMLLGSNYEKERISLGVKQLSSKTFKDDLKKLEKGFKLPCTVRTVKKDYLEVEIDVGLKGIVKKLDLATNKKDQKTDNFTSGDRIDATVVSFNEITGKFLLSLKDPKDIQEVEEEDFDYEQYIAGDDSGSTLGSILGNVLEESRAIAEKNVKKEKKEEKEKKEKKEKKKEKDK